MSARLATETAQDLRTLFHLGLVAGRTDGQLLEQFRSGAEAGAEAAFEALVSRHGPMVLRVCRRVLNDEHDAQDAFQATFLLLVRKAGTVRNQSSVSSWLYGVARRVAWRAKVAAARRRNHERQAAMTMDQSNQDPDHAPALETETEIVRSALDEEIERLPEKYRAPVVLCYLEGLTQERASEHLGWPAGTVRGRLSRARNLLRDRLARRGFAVPYASLVLGLSPQLPLVSPALLTSTVEAAATLWGGQALASVVPSAVAALIEGEPHARSFIRLKLAVALLGLGGLSAGGAMIVARSAPLTAPNKTLAGTGLGEGEAPAEPAQRLGRSLALPKTDTSKVKLDTLRDVPTTVATQDQDRQSAPAPVVVKHRPSDPNDPDREPSIFAGPLWGITIDGKLDDWPSSIPPHPIRNNLIPAGWKSREGNYARGVEQEAFFRVGYDVEDQRIYLAVVVHDEENVVGNESAYSTDAVEVFVDGLRTSRWISEPSGDWFASLKASEMPALQYVGVPGPGRAYGDPRRGNPALLYGDIARTRTVMAWSRNGEVTTYEWAIQVFDHYPDQPTKLTPGKRIGFDVAVVDVDPIRPSNDSFPTLVKPAPTSPPSYVTWGSAPSVMKGLDSGQLGDLILEGPP
jgi:RNA polymerase sigma factor (sigma-70 family)